MGPPIKFATSLDPESHWYKLEHLCEKEEEKEGEYLVISHGGNNKWGEWKCSVGTVAIEDLTPCTPCQKIEYTCRDTGSTIHKKTFCPVGAKYPDRRLNLMGDESPPEGKETDEYDEIEKPKKSCPQIKRDTIRFVSALWRRDCEIKTDGKLKDLLNESGPHCGKIKYTCPDDEGQSVSKEKQFCTKHMGTWEISMRQFLLGLSPSCTVEGTGRTGEWWKYYHGIVNKTNPSSTYLSGRWDEEETGISLKGLVGEYCWQKGEWLIQRKPPNKISYMRPVFFRNEYSVAPTSPWPWQTMSSALRDVCSPSIVEGGYVSSGYSDFFLAEKEWAETAKYSARKTLLCPARELLDWPQRRC